MATLVRDPAPPELDGLIERRRRLGQDLHDEVWDGVLHMNPAPGLAHALLQTRLGQILGPLAEQAGLAASGPFNLGDRDDYRVPDGGLHSDVAQGVWCATAAMVIEIISPDDETWEKLPFYSSHRVDELLVVDPAKRSVELLVLADGTYDRAIRSTLIDLDVDQLSGRIDWPA